MLKKLSIIVLTFIILLNSNIIVNAADKSLSDQIYTKLTPYGLTQGDRVKMERYITNNEITDDQAMQVLAKVDQAVAIMKSAGKTDVKKLSKEDAKEIISLAQEAADIVGLSLIIKTNCVEIYKDGKLVEAIDHSNTKLAYTGNRTNYILIFSSVAVLALTVSLIKKQKFSKKGTI